MIAVVESFVSGLPELRGVMELEGDDGAVEGQFLEIVGAEIDQVFFGADEGGRSGCGCFLFDRVEVGGGEVVMIAECF